VRHAGTAALVALIVARLAAALPHWSELAPTFIGRVLTVLDVRAGEWVWPAGVAAGLVYLLIRISDEQLCNDCESRPAGEGKTVTDRSGGTGAKRRGQNGLSGNCSTRLRGWPPALTRGLLLSAGAAALPLLLRPAPQPVLNADHVTVTRVSSGGETTALPFADLPRPAVVNVWATWCG
ncbi:hypothetical protein QOL99_17525, partial [Deinococcus sp. MIMF12]